MGPPYWDSDDERDRIVADRIDAELARPARGERHRQDQARRIRDMVAAALAGHQAWHEWLVRDGQRTRLRLGDLGNLAGAALFFALTGASAAQLAGLIK